MRLEEAGGLADCIDLLRLVRLLTVSPFLSEYCSESGCVYTSNKGESLLSSNRICGGISLFISTHGDGF
jgi:hypothetical protein